MPIRPADQSPVERALTIPPPVLGWNTKDPKSDMDPLYALDLENFFPDNGSVSLRPGSLWRSKGIGATNNIVILSPFEYVTEDGSRYLLAFSDAVYNCTSAGTATALTGGSWSSGEVYCTNFSGKVFIKEYSSGADVYYWDGAAPNVTAAAFTGPSGDDKALWRSTSYHGRLYFVEYNAASIWYGGFGSITGALTEFDMSTIFRLGGRIWYIGTISTGSNNTSSNQAFVVISECGEVVLYQGDYPGSATWSEVGHFFIAPPIFRKAFFTWGNDVVVITQEGVLSLQDVISAGSQSTYSYLSDNIAPTFKDSLEFVNNPTSAQFACGIHFPKGQMILINLIDTDGVSPIQYVMNTKSRGWCKYTGLYAGGWTTFQNKLYFGSGASNILQAETGAYDEDWANEGQIKARTIKCRHAFNYLSSPTKRKKFVAATPTVYQSEGLSITLNCDVDYSDTTATSTETDTSKGTDYQIYQPRCGLSAESGNAVSIRIDGTVTTKRFKLEATKVYYNDATDF